MMNRNISFSQVHKALFVVNPNNLSSERARLVIGFPDMELDAIKKWLYAFHPAWYDVEVVSDDEIREHAKKSPLPVPE